MSHDESQPAIQGHSPSNRHFPTLFRWRWWIFTLTVLMLYAGAVVRRWELCASEAADAAAEEQSYRARAEASDQTAKQAMSYQRAADYFDRRKWAFRLALVFPWRPTPPEVFRDPEAADVLWALPGYDPGDPLIVPTTGGY